MPLLREIEQFLRETQMPSTKFGRLSVRDPRLVGDLRNGRTPGVSMTKRVQDFIADWRARYAL
jgi:hypothetical protein